MYDDDYMDDVIIPLMIIEAYDYLDKKEKEHKKNKKKMQKKITKLNNVLKKGVLVK